MADDDIFAFNNDKDQKMIRYLIDKEFLSKKANRKGAHKSLWEGLAENMMAERQNTARQISQA